MPQQARLAALYVSITGAVLLGPLPATYSAVNPSPAVHIHSRQPLPMWNTGLPDMWTENMLGDTRFLPDAITLDINLDLL